MDLRLFSFLLLATIAPGEKVTRSESEWIESLGRERYNVMRRKGTERGFSGEHLFRISKGTYSCAACELPLFASSSKYDSGAGWPSFTQPIESTHVYYLEDWSMSFKRYEVLCRKCDSHLGHVFHDGPPTKNLRYCINSASLHFTKE